VTTNWKIPLRTAKPTYHDLATICVFIALLDFSGEQASKHEHSFKDAKKILLFIVEGGLFWADSVGDFTRMTDAWLAPKWTNQNAALSTNQSACPHLRHVSNEICR
jgi:hypothetical protein